MISEYRCLLNGLRQNAKKLFDISGRQQQKLHAWTSAKQVIDSSLKTIQQEGTWKKERIITSAQGPKIQVDFIENDRKQQKTVTNFCANNYLGLSSHPAVIEASLNAIKKYGAGLSSVRFICGTQDIHKELEQKIAKFHGREDAILYPSCFDANAGLFEAFLSPEDAIISDQLNHASIIDGIRLCKAQKHRYAHNNLEELNQILAECQSKSRLRLIATDGVFSMDGDVCRLPKIIELAQKYDALVFLDECHATGFFGQTGRGTEEFFHTKNPVDILNSTLGKALGGAAGGYTTSSKELIDLLRQKSRPYLFSNSLPPAVVAAASKVFDLLLTGEGYALVRQVTDNTKLFRNSMKEAGFKILGDEHPICPVYVGDARLATTLANTLFEKHGIYVVGFSYPVVPKGQARIRVQMSAAHTTEDVHRLIDGFVDVGRQYKVI